MEECSTHGENETCVHNFGRKTSKEGALRHRLRCKDIGKGKR